MTLAISEILVLRISASFSATLFKNDPDYLILASRISINNHHKNTDDNFQNVMIKLNEIGIISDDFVKLIDRNNEAINKLIKYDRDYLITYFGFKSLEKSYLLKIEDKH